VYLLDTNILIQAHKAHYPFDVMPSYWSKLLDLSATKEVGSIDKVKAEICGNNFTDDLARWCSTSCLPSFFEDTEQAIDSYMQVSRWANSSQRYSKVAIDEFLQKDYADAWLVAYAHYTGKTIVTYEIPDNYIKKKIKIPDACLHFNVPVIKPLQMLRLLQITI
jgi:hypothetical protein